VYSEAEEPLDRFEEDTVERWFTEEEVDELIDFTESLAAEKLKHQLSVEKKNGDREIKKRFDS
jgi:hypothetical protein